MKTLYTIGFTEKSAQNFFELLEANSVKTLVDIRLNNTSQLAGFTKRTDLEYFLNRITGISYIHAIQFAPTKELMERYKKGLYSREEFSALFTSLLDERRARETLPEYLLASACLLCSEPQASTCHRSIVAQYLVSTLPDFVIQHL